MFSQLEADTFKRKKICSMPCSALGSAGQTQVAQKCLWDAALASSCLSIGNKYHNRDPDTLLLTSLYVVPSLEALGLPWV